MNAGMPGLALHIHRPPNRQYSRFSKRGPAYLPPVRNTNNRLRARFFDKFDNIQSHLRHSKVFNEITDVCTTYIGRATNSRDSPYTLELSFETSAFCYAGIRLMGTVQAEMMVDTGATRTIMSMGYYEKHTCLHNLPKYESCSGYVTSPFTRM